MRCMFLQATLAAAVPGMASATSPDNDVLQEVVVTARRIVERAWELPLAIDVFTTETLHDTGTTGLLGVAELAPGFSFEPLFGASGGTTTLRGQSQATANGDNVAIFVDGVHQANRSVIDLELLDVERIELIRGPQNALFGHSAFAGAVQIVPRAPSRVAAVGWTLESGSDEWLSAQGFVSGPLAGSRWLGRIAASYRRADGTLADASRGSSLGGLERQAIVAAIARDTSNDEDWTASLSMRFDANASKHPAVASLYGVDFNCGSQNPASNLWSYYCGRAPSTRTFELSGDVPDSDSQAGQLAVRFAAPLGRFRLELDGSAYLARAKVMRDFDASSSGQPFGVCEFGTSCLGSSGQPALVDRIVHVNEVLAQRPEVQQVSQDLRLRGSGSGEFDWLVGLVYIDTRERSLVSIGAERGPLAASERLLALLPGSPEVAGPVSRMNLALVDDPAATQVDQARSYEHRRTVAGYGAANWRPHEAVALRAELRGTWERLDTDSVTANFVPSFGTAIPSQEFHDFTPRFSADYAWSELFRTYLSAAKGSRSGGVNLVPGLIAEEQTFEPESNWTYEAGLRWATSGVLRELRATAYYIDWSNTQIRGYSTTPDVPNLITLNTAGMTTKGLEASFVLQPTRWLRAHFDYSRLDARFRQGSDDPSAGDICGLAPGRPTSTFCTVGPPRTPTPNSPALVPWLDGHLPAQVPRTSWHAALIMTLAARSGGWQPMVRIDASHQDEMYDRGVNAFTYGDRTLLDARISATRGPWALELWGRNLTNDHYARSYTSRQAQFYPTSPRPLDFIYGDGRRIGFTVRFER